MFQPKHELSFDSSFDSESTPTQNGAHDKALPSSQLLSGDDGHLPAPTLALTLNVKPESHSFQVASRFEAPDEEDEPLLTEEGSRWVRKYVKYRNGVPITYF